MAEAEKFCDELVSLVNLPIEFENEFLTSVFAGETVGRDKDLDARAAAIILQRHLDRSR
jgi:RNase H-fold protein (predicted Holliday junction resolvase)